MCIFQSTLPREERRKKQSYNVRNRQFQSTLPREERPLYAFNIILYVYFNPRSHERSDAYSPCLFFKKGISIHAPTRGATGGVKMAKIVYLNFNPRSHERSDNARLFLTWLSMISIHAPTRGATAILHKKFVYFYTIPTINI